MTASADPPAVEVPGRMPRGYHRRAELNAVIDELRSALGVLARNVRPDPRLAGAEIVGEAIATLTALTARAHAADPRRQAMQAENRANDRTLATFDRVVEQRARRGPRSGTRPVDPGDAEMARRSAASRARFEAATRSTGGTP